MGGGCTDGEGGAARDEVAELVLGEARRGGGVENDGVERVPGGGVAGQGLGRLERNGDGSIAVVEGGAILAASAAETPV